jgi:hypothetical protein
MVFLINLDAFSLICSRNNEIGKVFFEDALHLNLETLIRVNLISMETLIRATSLLIDIVTMAVAMAVTMVTLGLFPPLVVVVVIERLISWDNNPGLVGSTVSLPLNDP